MAKKSRFRLSGEDLISAKKYISHFLCNLIDNNGYTKTKIARILEVSTRTVVNYIDETNFPEVDVLLLMGGRLGLDLNVLSKFSSNNAAVVSGKEAYETVIANVCITDAIFPELKEDINIKVSITKKEKN